MKLKDLRLPSADVSVADGGSFSVRGITLTDITVLLKQHSQALEVLFLEAQGGEGIEGVDQVRGLASGFLEKAPEAAAHIIALASGEDSPAVRAIAQALPFPVQVAALEQIAVLTFGQEGGAKKAAETVIRVLQGVTKFIGEAREPSVSGFGASEEPSVSS